MTGIEVIAIERQRQIDVEGWTPEHDDSHDKGELARAAEAYLHANFMLSARSSNSEYDLAEIKKYLLHFMWPLRWEASALKISADPVENLTKAGALIAAEIDRLNRKNG